MRLITSIVFCSFLTHSFAQNKPGTTFSGTSAKDPEVCAASAGNFLNEKQVEDMISEMLGKVGARSRYIIVNCTQVENCQAFLFRGKPYILYNPNFLGQVKKLNFSSASLPSATDKDWETLTILAHELGHHINNHLLNPLPDATQREMELEADETAGFIIYLLGGSLTQAKLAFNNIPEKGSYTHPARQSRLEAVERGWYDAQTKYPRSIITPVAGPVSDRDGNLYKSVKIGDQVWLQSNLNAEHFRDGSPIREVRSKEEWNKACEQGNPAWCYYDNDPANGEKYGRLYNWFAVNDPKGLAPAGYHISTWEEWEQLELFLGSNAGDKLKETGLWNNSYDKSTNSSQFSGLPGGDRNPEGVFEYLGKSGRWWCANRFDRSGFLSGRELLAALGTIDKITVNKYEGLSVRCLKD